MSVQRALKQQMTLACTMAAHWERLFSPLSRWIPHRMQSYTYRVHWPKFVRANSVRAGMTIVMEMVDSKLRVTLDSQVCSCFGCSCWLCVACNKVDGESKASAPLGDPLARAGVCRHAPSGATVIWRGLTRLLR